jgi:hypothetical protein
LEKRRKALHFSALRLLRKFLSLDRHPALLQPFSKFEAPFKRHTLPHLRPHHSLLPASLLRPVWALRLYSQANPATLIRQEILGRTRVLRYPYPGSIGVSRKIGAITDIRSVGRVIAAEAGSNPPRRLRNRRRVALRSTRPTLPHCAFPPSANLNVLVAIGPHRTRRAGDPR